MRFRHFWPVTLPALLALSLAGCASKTTPGQSETPAASPSAAATEEAQSSSGASTSPEASAEGTAEPSTDESWSAEPQSSEGQAAEEQVVTDFRVGSHDGFDRVVIEFSGDTVPSWNVDWVTAPAQQGKGEALSLTGPSFLRVQVTGVTDPIGDELGAKAYTASGEKDAGSIRAYFDSTFEGNTQVVLGMDQNRPFRVSALTDPVRIVIDVQTP